MKNLTAFLFALLLLSGTAIVPVFGQASASDSAYQEEDEISRAFRILKKTGIYEEKKAVLRVFRENYRDERVTGMILDLMEYNFDNPAFRENDQGMYYEDVIAEELIKILGQNAKPMIFPSLLHVVLYNRRHREATVNAAWDAMKKIKW